MAGNRKFRAIRRQRARIGSHRRRLLYKLSTLGLVLAAIGVSYGGYATLFPDRLGRAEDKLLSDLPTGHDLNVLAWKATYTERGLPTPVDGPREGYSGARLGENDTVPHPVLDWHTGEVHIPGLWESDAKGYQRVEAPCEPSIKIVIHGGSVAEGAYASSIRKTYFARTAALLHERGHCASIVVSGGAGWTTVNELAALKHRAIPEEPDIVLFLNGLNDLTDYANLVPEEERTDTYLRHMERARDEALGAGMEIVFALQPNIHQKKTLSPIEEWIVKLERFDTLVTKEYPKMAAGLQTLADEKPATHFIDCSGTFDDEPYTTLADLWHFSDPGHELLALELAEGLTPIVIRLNASSDRLHRRTQVP